MTSRGKHAIWSILWMTYMPAPHTAVTRPGRWWRKPLNRPRARRFLPVGVNVEKITLTVNGKAASGRVEARLSLADFLRHHMRLTGTHVGCNHGVCGACTVIVDGRLARSCLMFAVQAEGAKITTVEGLGDGGSLSP